MGIRDRIKNVKRKATYGKDSFGFRKYQKYVDKLTDAVNRATDPTKKADLQRRLDALVNSYNMHVSRGNDKNTAANKALAASVKAGARGRRDSATAVGNTDLATRMKGLLGKTQSKISSGSPYQTKEKRRRYVNWMLHGSKDAGEGHFGSPLGLLIGIILSILAYFLISPAYGGGVGFGIGLGLFSFFLGNFMKNDVAKNSLKITSIVILGIASVPINYLITLIILLIGYFSISKSPVSENNTYASYRTIIGALIPIFLGLMLARVGITFSIIAGFVLITIGMFLFNYDGDEK